MSKRGTKNTAQKIREALDKERSEKKLEQEKLDTQKHKDFLAEKEKARCEFTKNNITYQDKHELLTLKGVKLIAYLELKLEKLAGHTVKITCPTCAANVLFDSGYISDEEMSKLHNELYK